MAYRSKAAVTAPGQSQIQIRVAPQLKKRLVAEAFRRTVSLNFLAEKAIEDALKVWEKQKL
jgi:predicted HicB family RNase H-like nuclease